MKGKERRKGKASGNFSRNDMRLKSTLWQEVYLLMQ